MRMRVGCEGMGVEGRIEGRYEGIDGIGERLMRNAQCHYLSNDTISITPTADLVLDGDLETRGRNGG